MATFNFSTGGNAVGKIDHSATRSASGYTVNFNVYLKRTTAYRTKGTIGYNVFVNNSSVASGTKGFTITSDMEWCLLISGTKSVSVGEFDSGSYTVGIECTDKSGANISAYNISKQTSTANNGNGTYSAYATHTGKSTIEIIDTGKNGFKIRSTIGANGTNKKATGCHIYYNVGKSSTDTTDPHWTSATNTNFIGSVVHTGSAGARKDSDTIAIDTTKLASNETLVVKAVGYTQPDAVKSDMAEETIIYYSPPPSLPAPPVLATGDGKKPTPKSNYILSWNKATSTNSNSNSPLDGYYLEVYYNNDLIIQDSTINKDAEEINLLDYLKGNNIPLSNLKRNDTIYCKLQPYSRWGNRDYHNGTLTTSNTITIGSVASMRVKINEGTPSIPDYKWKEGQVWVKVDGVWKEAAGVWVKKDGVWYEAL